MKQLATALAETEERMLQLAYKPVRERLADALLLLLRTYQHADQQQFSIAISRDDLAALVGTAKETTIRLLSELKDEGTITTKGSQITVLKPQRLIQIAAQYE
jgi:CRP-like cAMP-binding protein